ncbi:MAG: sulfatase-like hydrolase/transferase [Thermoguttaceae bacterium]
MNAILLVVDRLHAGYVGALGNGWIDTPAIDRLAFRSLVFDQMLVDTPRLEALYRSYWQGWHALGPPPENRPSLAALLRDAGIHSALVSDDRTVHEHPLAVDFDEIVAIDPPWQTRVAAAGRYDQTHLARCFVQIIDYLQSAQGPLLLWCHLASLGTTWDAPLEFRQRYWEEGDPPPPRSAEVPDCRLGPDPDPDEVLGITHAYAGQVSLLDACLGGLGEFLRDSPLASQTLLGLTSARGFPLGEHGRIGPCDEALYGELLHVPLLMQFPDNRGAAVRSQTLVEPADLWATLLDYWGLGDGLQSPSAASLLPSPGGEVTLHRDRLCAGGHAAERAIRTPAWHLRRTAVPELFAKPDDYWEANNVAPRCREVVECLEDALVEFEQTLQVGQTADLPPLSDVLLNGME